MSVGKEIWRSEKGDVWVEQDKENLLFYSKSTVEGQSPKPTVVDFSQLQEIVDSTDNPEDADAATLHLSNPDNSQKSEVDNQ